MKNKFKRQFLHSYLFINVLFNICILLFFFRSLLYLNNMRCTPFGIQFRGEYLDYMLMNLMMLKMCAGQLKSMDA